MDTWQLLWPALLAGGVAIGVTLAIERLGGRTGGLIATLPTTIVPASLGIYAQISAEAEFAQAMGAVPAGMLLNIGFLYLWRRLPPVLPPLGLAARLALMTGLSLAAWAAGALLLIIGLSRLEEAAAPPLALGTAVTLVSIAAGALACLRAPPAPAGSRRVGPLTLAARGTLAGAAIAAAVWLAHVAGPLAAGMASVFPAIFLTTMASLWISQGEAVQVGAVGPMMLGSASVSAFALAAALLFPLLGPAVGAVAAWAAAVLLVTLPAWRWLSWLQARTALR